jgi:hypothetical protein
VPKINRADFITLPLACQGLSQISYNLLSPPMSARMP